MTDAVQIALITGGVSVCLGGIAIMGQIVNGRIAAKALVASNLATIAANNAAQQSIYNREALEKRDAVQAVDVQKNLDAISNVHKKVDELGKEINGRMGELLAVTGSSERAKGVLDEKSRDKTHDGDQSGAAIDSAVSRIKGMIDGLITPTKDELKP